MFDMSKLHLLFTNNSAGLYAKIDGTMYKVTVSQQKHSSLKIMEEGWNLSNFHV
jgi:hypothetical protein